jgi:zinc and cadmium transporter
MRVELLSIISVVAVSLVSLIGLLTILMGRSRMERVASSFVGFAAGALLGDAFIHLIPETFSEQSPPLGRSLLILGGMMVFFVVEKLMRHRHSLHPEILISRPEMAAVNVLGDAVHNFIDGVLIGASYLASPTLGVSTTAAVLLHEIPQEFADFSILIHSGVPVRKAVLLNLASASVAILGTITVLIAGALAGYRITSALLPATAGGFVYLAAADLIPELQRERTMRSLLVQTALLSAGIALMALLTYLE